MNCGKYDNSTQAYHSIGAPQNGWPVLTMYSFVQLLTLRICEGADGSGNEFRRSHSLLTKTVAPQSRQK